MWAPLGERPIAHGHHRFDWLYVTAFVSPATGETFWYVSNGVSKEFFEALLETFAREAEAGLSCIILLVLDNAGWHGPANLKIPDGVRLIYLPPYSPELQPAETLWALVDEPIVNQHIATITDLDEKIEAGALYGRAKRLRDLLPAQRVDLQAPLNEELVRLLAAECFHRDQVAEPVPLHSPVSLSKRQIRVLQGVVIVPKLAELFRFPDFLIAGIIAMPRL